MKNIIVKANGGALTNFEVLDLLNSRGASNDTTRVIAPITTSEYKVYDYLTKTPACTQTQEIITNFSDQCKDFKLAKAEILNIINIRPSFTGKKRITVQLAPILEESAGRDIDRSGVLELVEALLPPPPIVEARGENEKEEIEEVEQS